MLLVIITKSLIRLDSAVRTSLNDDCMTETDSGITRGYRREREGVGTNTNNDDITRGYN